ncbi:MAG: hypothetical protein FJY10_05145 [Bacteroidetes bacterium]|nr:hypothetical protein [Bacteroidota bacterium]
MTELIESITLFAYILRFSDPIKAFKTGCPPASSSTPPPLPRRNFSIRGLVFLKYLSLPKKMILLHYLNWPEIFQAICILLVGIIAGCFAYFQWRTTNNKLKLDLFDKRFFIFKSVSGFIGKVVTQRRLE